MTHRRPCTSLAPAILAAGTAVLCASAAGAAGPFVPPQGCRLELTVQERACSVAQHYRCDAAPGDWHSDWFADGGVPSFSSHIDAETRWLDSRDPQSGITDRLQPGAADPASLTALLASGSDSYDFWTVASDGLLLHHTGEDRLTSETVTIDGQPLLRTTFHLTTRDEAGGVVITRAGHQYVSRDLRLFFGGTERQTDGANAEVAVDNSPVRFIRPGQPGFASTQPVYDCEVLTAALTPDPQARP